VLNRFRSMPRYPGASLNRTMRGSRTRVLLDSGFSRGCVCFVTLGHHCICLPYSKDTESKLGPFLSIELPIRHAQNCGPVERRLVVVADLVGRIGVSPHLLSAYKDTEPGMGPFSPNLLIYL
jgi:hypothetical protein